MSLVKVKLAEIADIQTGPFGSQLHQSDYVEHGTPIITVEHLGDDRIKRENLPLVNDDDKNRLSRYHLKEGDTVFSRVGSVDRASYVHKEEDGWLFSGRCLRVRPEPKKVDPRYLSFYLRSLQFTSYIKSIAVGATMPSINTSLLETSPVLLVDFLQQQKIGHFLDTIERKIELNRRMNETLEQIGQALFKKYFVDNPESENWNTGKASDLFELTMGLSPKGDTYNDDGVGVPLLNGAADFKNGLLKPSRHTSEPTRISKIGDIIFCIRGTIGNVTIGRKKYCLGRGVSALTPIKNAQGYVYFHTQNEIERFKSSASGSVIKGLTKDDIANVKIKQPPIEMMEEFESVASKILSRIENIHYENELLTQIRDSLLPKLISGEVAV